MQGFFGASRKRCLFSFRDSRFAAAMLDMAASCTIESLPNSSAAPRAGFL